VKNDEPSASVSLPLRKLRQKMKDQDVAQVIPGDPFRYLDTAIETLEARGGTALNSGELNNPDR
jgi:hypothetical protein